MTGKRSFPNLTAPLLVFLPSFLLHPFLSSVFGIGSPFNTTHVLEWDCTQAEPLSLLLSHQTRVCCRFEDLRGTWWCFFRKYGFESPLHFLWLQEEWLLLSRLIMLRLGPFPSWIPLLRSGLSQGSSFTRICSDKWKSGSRQLLMVWKRSRPPLSTFSVCVYDQLSDHLEKNTRKAYFEGCFQPTLLLWNYFLSFS